MTAQHGPAKHNTVTAVQLATPLLHRLAGYVRTHNYTAVLEHLEEKNQQNTQAHIHNTLHYVCCIHAGVMKDGMDMQQQQQQVCHLQWHHTLDCACTGREAREPNAPTHHHCPAPTPYSTNPQRTTKTHTTGTAAGPRFCKLCKVTTYSTACQLYRMQTYANQTMIVEFCRLVSPPTVTHSAAKSWGHFDL